MNKDYAVAAFLLAIPTAVLLALPMYNRINPQLLGLPFFYWFQGLWLFISAGMYIYAAMLLGKNDKDSNMEGVSP